MDFNKLAEEEIDEQLEYESDNSEYEDDRIETQNGDIESDRHEDREKFEPENRDGSEGYDLSVIEDEIEENEEHYERQFEEDFEQDFEDDDNIQFDKEIQEHNVENSSSSSNCNTEEKDKREQPDIQSDIKCEIALPKGSEYMDDFSESENEESEDETTKTNGENTEVKFTEERLTCNTEPDSFSDDELIEYVDDHEGSEEIAKQENTENSLSKIPIYLDFSEVCGEEEMVLKNMLVKEEVKINFDFMKLFPPNTEEDELFSEFDSLFENFEECIELRFHDIFQRIARALKIGLDEFNIHLTFGDLLNLTMESDSVSCNEVTLKDLLAIYERLKNQSPNSDLYGFLSVKVWLTRTGEAQLDILKNASFRGYRLENLNTITTLKRSPEGEGRAEIQNKRVKTETR